MGERVASILYAFLAAVFYAINVPASKLLLNRVPATFMAAFLYLGAGLGVGIMYVFHWRKEEKAVRIKRKDLPYTVGMIVLDIIAPVFLMIGIKYGTAANASLLGNFEIVSTTVIALWFFNESISKRMWLAVVLITLSSIILSFEGSGSFKFSFGSVFVLLAAICWGLENNCTKSICDKSPYEIVVLKGLLSGSGSFIIALFCGEKLPKLKYVFPTMLLGFVAYGLSIFMYVKAQRDLGAAKTSAYYAVAPFVGAFMSFVLIGESLSWLYLAAFSVMSVGTALVVADTLKKQHYT